MFGVVSVEMLRLVDELFALHRIRHEGGRSVAAMGAREELVEQ